MACFIQLFEVFQQFKFQHILDNEIQPIMHYSIGKVLKLRMKRIWSKMTLNYRMMVGRYPNLKEEVGKSISGYEIFSLPNGKLVMWSTVSCALALAIKKSFLMKMIVFCCTTMAVVTYMPRSFG
jgi:hypothetical protein